jgi:death-on-curing protein
VAFVVMAVFVGLNGLSVKADEDEVVTVMLAPADGKVSEKELATWLREHSTKTKGRGAV